MVKSYQLHTFTLRSVWVVACLWMLSSCASPQPVTTSVAVAKPEVAPVATANAQRYRIVAAQSMLHILVYRGGSMAQLGHNHVVSSDAITGEVWLDEALGNSSFAIEFPVNDLIVDDPQARSAEGPDFPLKVDDEARAGTRRNMLKPELLDGEHFPAIRLRSTTISGTHEQPEVTAQITIKDQTREVILPVQLSVTDQTLHATGQFEIRQTDFGIKPFSVMMGALQVQDRLMIRFELVAILEQ